MALICALKYEHTWYLRHLPVCGLGCVVEAHGRVTPLALHSPSSHPRDLASLSPASVAASPSHFYPLALPPSLGLRPLSVDVGSGSLAGRQHVQEQAAYAHAHPERRDCGRVH